MAYAKLHLGDFRINAKGAKMAPLTDAGGRCFHTFTEATKAPSGSTNFDNHASVLCQNVDIRVPGEAASYFRGLDDWAVDYIAAHSERLFKKHLSLQQGRDSYNPCIRQAPGYAVLRCKINMPNTRGACRHCTAQSEERDAPWIGATLI
jgi:hypothetical protein